MLKSFNRLVHCIAFPLNRFEYSNLRYMMELFDVYRLPFAATAANVSRLAHFGVAGGLPGCPFNATFVECDVDGHIIRLYAVRISFAALISHGFVVANCAVR